VCVNRHIMQPQYDSWQKASHHSITTCIDCHGEERIDDVPGPRDDVKLQVVSGATIVTYFGFARMMRSATRTRNRCRRQRP
jgi:hypothetical protein